MGLCLAQALLTIFAPSDPCQSLPIIIHTHPDDLLIHDIGHIAIDEASVQAASFLINHEHPFLFGNNTDLPIVIKHMEVGGLLQGTESIVEDAFVVRIPGLGEVYQKVMNHGTMTQTLEMRKRMYRQGTNRRGDIYLRVHYPSTSTLSYLSSTF